jgi:ribosome maturation factor RimP
VQGVLVAADDQAATVRLDDAELSERVIAYSQIDRAKTVFVWGPAPKPGKAPSAKKAPGAKKASNAATAADTPTPNVGEPTSHAATQEAS